jgi:transcriptional regulator with XRE-family HTH domain
MPQTIEDLEHILGDAIRSHRVRQGLTQTELAERANVALGALKAIEQGRNATTATLMKVLRVLGQTEWVNRLSPPDPTFSPMELLEERRSNAKGPARVRRSRIKT